MRYIKIISFILIGLFFTGCGVYNSLMNLSKLQFKLGTVSGFKVGNISISQISKLSDFNALDILKLTSNVAQGSFPVSFILNVETKNPNSNSTSSSSDLTLQSFPWTLYIDNVKTISGNISQPLTVPAGGETRLIPIEMNMDLMDFFKNQGLDSILNLALKLGGEKSTSSNIKIIAESVLGTAIGNLKYPDPITIIDQNFN